MFALREYLKDRKKLKLWKLFAALYFTLIILGCVVVNKIGKPILIPYVFLFFNLLILYGIALADDLESSQKPFSRQDWIGFCYWIFFFIMFVSANLLIIKWQLPVLLFMVATIDMTMMLTLEYMVWFFML